MTPPIWFDILFSFGIPTSALWAYTSYRKYRKAKEDYKDKSERTCLGCFEYPRYLAEDRLCRDCRQAIFDYERDKYPELDYELEVAKGWTLGDILNNVGKIKVLSIKETKRKDKYK